MKIHYLFSRASQRWSLGIALALGLSSTALANPTPSFPSGPVTIVPFGSPGGVIDVIARYYGEHLSQRWGQPVIVVNRPGAAGVIAAQHVARAPADGQTMMLTINVSHVNQPLLNATIPYDSKKDFRPVAMVGSSSAVLATNPEAPFSNISELISWAKDNPGITYGSLGPGSTGHLFGELLQREEGINLNHVPYKSEAAYISDLIGQRLDVSWVGPGSSAEYSKNGRLKLLGVAGNERSSLLPNLPSFKEQGYDGYDLLTWVGLFVPAGTPESVVQEIGAAFKEISESDGAKQVVFTAGFDPAFLGPDTFPQQFEHTFDYTAKLLEELNISLD